MGKIHVLMRKEDIDEEQIIGKIAVVFDVLLATSTMTAALYDGAKEVIPVLDGDHALNKRDGREEGSYLLVGEYEGRTIEGFLDPSPLGLQQKVRGKTVILSTTNGTVAVRRSSAAKKVYIASLLNGESVAREIKEKCKNETIVLVCSGSGGSFCLEDFYGAGYFLQCLTGNSEGDWELTDAARAALHFYDGKSDECETMLSESRVGGMLSKFGFEKEIRYVAQREILSIVPYLEKEAIVLEDREKTSQQSVGTTKGV
jgi:2-phosphosulfolactate phosphatase